jgi:hypothetical protein
MECPAILKLSSLYGIILLLSIANVVGNVGPKSDHVEWSDLAKRFFIAGWEREESRESQ